MFKLTPAAERFVLHWGEMGARWGINRTVAQIHALLYVSPTPLSADRIVATLSVARSNVSNSLRELQGWGIVKVVHILGDRRDHFESMTDVWEMFRIVLDERKRREIDPTLAVLVELTASAKKSGKKDAHTHKQLAEMLAFFEEMSSWYDQMRRMPIRSIRRFVNMGEKLQKLLGGVR